jgi:hypothetical protein
MIGVTNPYNTQLEDAERSRAEIVRDYGPAAEAALVSALELQRAAFRMGARLQLEACCADLRNWTVAYDARATAIALGQEPSDDGRTDAAIWSQVAIEIRLFARDWLREAADDAGRSALDQ